MQNRVALEEHFVVQSNTRVVGCSLCVVQSSTGVVLCSTE